MVQQEKVLAARLYEWSLIPRIRMGGENRCLQVVPASSTLPLTK